MIVLQVSIITVLYGVVFRVSLASDVELDVGEIGYVGGNGSV